jgi:hypothetical protein
VRLSHPRPALIAPFVTIPTQVASLVAQSWSQLHFPVCGGATTKHTNPFVRCIAPSSLDDDLSAAKEDPVKNVRNKKESKQQRIHNLLELIWPCREGQFFLAHCNCRLASFYNSVFATFDK